VDLLSGHRSFEAAEILLEHLFDRRVAGHASVALQGAIARSMNVALVDGLLRCVESPGGRPLDTVCLAATSLGMRRSAESVEPLVALSAEGNDVTVREAAVMALGRIGKHESVASLADCLSTDALAEHAALALLMMGDARGLHFHREALTHGRTDLTGHPAEIVGRYGGPENLLLLKTVAQQQDDVGRGALLGLGLLGDTRGAGTILAALRSRDASVVAAASGALTLLTGHHQQPDEPNVRQRWEQWWHEHGASLQPGIRYRGGKPHAFGMLLEEMDHADPYVRRTAYGELVISSGSHLPFDADGPWRVQRAHLRAWRSWWAAKREAYPPGAWFLAGRPQ
jgi:HEAT repeat protein